MKKNELDYIEWKEWGSDNFGSYTNEENILFSTELNRAGVVLDQDIRVLEIGFGNGAFLGWVKQYSCHYIGIEINNALIARAKAAGAEAYASIGEMRSQIGDKKFDLIIAFDVIEHMPINDIISSLEAWANYLSKNGCILIRIPSGDSPFSGRIMYGDITHKTLLASTALRQIASLTGLYLVATYPPALPIFGLGPLKAFERAIVKATRYLITFLVNATFHGNRHGVVTSNLVAILKHDVRASKHSTR